MSHLTGISPTSWTDSNAWDLNHGSAVSTSPLNLRNVPASRHQSQSTSGAMAGFTNEPMSPRNSSSLAHSGPQFSDDMYVSPMSPPSQSRETCGPSVSLNQGSHQLFRQSYTACPEQPVGFMGDIRAADDVLWDPASSEFSLDSSIGQTSFCSPDHQAVIPASVSTYGIIIPITNSLTSFGDAQGTLLRQSVGSLEQ